MTIKTNNNLIYALLITTSYIQSDDTIQKQLTEQEQAIITTIVEHVIDTAIENLEEAIQAMQQIPISLQDARTLLQNQTESLVLGSTFQLNGTRYIVQNLKTMEIIPVNNQMTENN